MPIDHAVVRRIAELARIEIPEDEIERTAAQLSEVLEYAAVIGRLDLEGCEPTSYAPAEAPLREDDIDGRRLGHRLALESAPEADGGFFLVPPIVENVNP